MMHLYSICFTQIHHNQMRSGIQFSIKFVLSYSPECVALIFFCGLEYTFHNSLDIGIS